MELPEWLQEETWNEWIDYRRQDKKKPASERSQRMTLKKLAQLREQGYCPTKLIETAIEREWQGIYPSEECRNENGRRNSEKVPRSAVERVRMANAAALEGNGPYVAPNDGNIRPQMDERARGRTDRNVVEGAFRVVGGRD